MVFEDYLLDGELILARAGELYATDKRLIRYKQVFNGEEFDDIPYTRITSIGIVRNRRPGLIKVGIVVALIGLFTLLAMNAVMPFLESTTQLWGNINQGAAGSAVMRGMPFIGLDFASMLKPLVPLSIVILVMGLVIVGLGIFLTQVYIQFQASGLNANTEARFRLNNIRDEASLYLARIVRLQSIDRQAGADNFIRKNAEEVIPQTERNSN